MIHTEVVPLLLLQLAFRAELPGGLGCQVALVDESVPLAVQRGHFCVEQQSPRSRLLLLDSLVVFDLRAAVVVADRVVLNRGVGM